MLGIVGKPELEPIAAEIQAKPRTRPDTALGDIAACLHPRPTPSLADERPPSHRSRRPLSSSCGRDRLRRDRDLPSRAGGRRPFGHAAWGGARAHVSTAQRSGSAAAVVVWTAAALVVPGAPASGEAPGSQLFSAWEPWFLAAVSAIAAGMNFASQSRGRTSSSPPRVAARDPLHNRRAKQQPPTTAVGRTCSG
jgi:hypothetical protein